MLGGHTRKRLLNTKGQKGLRRVHDILWDIPLTSSGSADTKDNDGVAHFGIDSSLAYFYAYSQADAHRT